MKGPHFLRTQVFSSFQNLCLFWRLSAALTIFVLMLGLFSGCGKMNPEEQMVWDKYENYRYLDWYNENKAWILVESHGQNIFQYPWNRIPMDHLREALKAKSLERGTLVYSEHIRPDVSKEFLQGKDVLVIKLTNPKILERLSENEKYADDFSKRFYVVNAETLERIPVSVLPWVTRAEVYGYENIKRDKVDFFQDYFNGFIIDFKNQPVEKARFIIICFQGIPKTESEEFETLPLFFVVERNKDYYSTVLTRTPKLLDDPLKKNTAVAASASATTAAAPTPLPATAEAGKAKASPGKTGTPKAQDVKSTKRAAEKGDVQRKNTSAAKSAPGLPVTISAYGSSYTVNKYEITKDEKGNTKIILIGHGFDVVPIRDGRMVSPLWCNFISGNAEIKATGAGVENGNAVYFFDTSAEPETLILYPGDNVEKKVRIQVQPGK